MTDTETVAEGMSPPGSDGGGFALLFELVGCFFYVVEVRMSLADFAALPLDQRAMLEARPSRFYAAFAIAVGVGDRSIGRAAKAGRRPCCSPADRGDCPVQQHRHRARNAARPHRMRAVPIVIIIGCYSIWQLARLAARRGWLRLGRSA